MIHELGFEDFYDLRDQAGAGVPANNSSAVGASIGYSRSKPESLLDDLEAAGVAVESASDGLCRVRLAVEGVHCAACAWLIDRVQPTIRGLHSAQVRMSDQTVELIYDPNLTHPKYVSRSFARLGYGLSPVMNDESDLSAFRQQQRDHLTGIALAAFFAANAMWIGVALYAGEWTGMQANHATFLRWVGTVLAILAAFIPGIVFFRSAWNAIMMRTPHIDIPVALSLLIGVIGTIAGTVSGSGHIYFDSLTSLILLLRIGRFIQFRAQYSTSRSIAKLMRMNQGIASRMEPDGSIKKIPSHRLNRGDSVYVAMNETIPADGVVIKSPLYLNSLFLDEISPDPDYVSKVDCSLLNGESDPVRVRIGDCVVGGTINLSSPICVQVSASGEQSRVGRLMSMVRQATELRTPWLKAADRVGKWFVVLVLVLAVATWVAWSMAASMSVATQHTIALLTIACPCALALAAPIVLTVAMGRAARKRIWIRDGNCLERLAVPGMMWLDKTGTLTVGRMRVLNWIGDEKWLPFVWRLEKEFSHPVARAIVDFVESDLPGAALQPVAGSLGSYELQDTVSQSNGIQSQVEGHHIALGNQSFIDSVVTEIEPDWLDRQDHFLRLGQSTVWLSVDGRIAGLFAMGDPLRDDASTTLLSIQARGWRVGILSGDRQEVVDHVAAELASHGVKFYAALGNQTPEDKLLRVSKFDFHSGNPQGQPHTQSNLPAVVMVGDGINDSAALAAADVGIAIRGGSEQSLHAARIYLADGRLQGVDELTEASRKVVKGIQRCFAASLLYNSGTISLAMLGWIHPLIAAVLMPISGITVLAMAICTKSFSRD
jgi:P-type Cu2+ transporter